MNVDELCDCGCDGFGGPAPKPNTGGFDMWVSDPEGDYEVLDAGVIDEYDPHPVAQRDVVRPLVASDLRRLGFYRLDELESLLFDGVDREAMRRHFCLCDNCQKVLSVLDGDS